MTVELSFDDEEVEVGAGLEGLPLIISRHERTLASADAEYIRGMCAGSLPASCMR